MAGGGGVSVVGLDPRGERISVTRAGADLVFSDARGVLGRFAASSVAAINITTGAGNDVIAVAQSVTTPTTINAGAGKNVVRAGGGPTAIVGVTGNSIAGGGTGA